MGELWKEDVVVYPLVRGKPGAALETHVEEGHHGKAPQAWLVHGSFRIALGDAMQSLKVDSRQYISSSIDAILSHVGARREHVEVTYTRGSRGIYQMPGWFVDRGPGLVIEQSKTGRENVNNNIDLLYGLIGRALGCSASSSAVMKTGWVEEEGQACYHVGVSAQDFPCIESIRQWMSLLPCRGQRGLSEFVKSLRLLQTPYHSIRLVIDDGERVEVEVSTIVHRQRVNHDVDGLMKSRRHHMNQMTYVKEVIESLVGNLNMIHGTCPVVEASDLYLYIARDRKYVKVPREGDDFDSISCEESTWSQNSPYNVEVSNGIIWKSPLEATLSIQVHASQVEDTGIRSYKSISVRQMIPWQVVHDPSSLQIRLGSHILWPRRSVHGHAPVLQVEWAPTAPRKHAGFLSIHMNDVFSIYNQTRSTPLSIEFGVERPVLSVFDYPPDVSRGIDIPAPRVTLYGQSHDSLGHWMCNHANQMTVAGQNVLFQLPIPDASMPFNVACFTATLISLIFGSVIHILLWSKSDLEEIKKNRKSIKARLKRFLIVSVVGFSLLAYLDPSTAAMVEQWQLRIQSYFG
jgi:phosphatidylinositol glycan class T